MHPVTGRWLRADGYPPDLYFTAVAEALAAAGVPAAEWWRDADWDVTFKLDPTGWQDGPLGEYEAVYIGWSCEDNAPTTGHGWHWVPYSSAGKPLGDFSGDLWLDLVAEPEDVAARVALLVHTGGGGPGQYDRGHWLRPAAKETSDG